MTVARGSATRGNRKKLIGKDMPLAVWRQDYG